jgi:acetolactate synthase-1/2/3 large subunit
MRLMSRGANLVVRALAASGVRHLFSLSGNQILSIYDATIGSDVAILHVRHEAAAVHMADGWGRTTEEPGVALVTAGPGHLNAVSALYTALMSESPVVLLSGHAPQAQLGRGAFQEVDQVTAARPVVKAAWRAEHTGRLGEDIVRAIGIARAWPPGPVHVSLPGDLLEAPVVSRTEPIPRAPTDGPPASAPAIGEALESLASARRPLIIVGPAMGRPRRRPDVDRLSEITGAPALLLESPRGVQDPALRGAAPCLAEADVVLLLGKRLDFSLRFGDTPAFAAGCRFVHADIGARTGPRVSVAVSGAPPVVVRQLIEAARQRPWPRSSWADEVAAARRAVPAGWEALGQAPAVPLHPLLVCRALQPLVAGGVLVSDGGEFGQWCQAALEPAWRLINGPSGSIGSALPMALGAKLAQPERTVIATLGDGTFGFHALELDTAARHGLAVVTVVGNDARWNAEHQIQLRQYGAERAVGCSLVSTRYDRLAGSLGAHGEHVERAEDLAPAMERALKSGRPACVNVVIDGAAAPVFAAGASH